MQKIVTVFVLMCITSTTFAQYTEESFMRSNQKIYVSVAVLLVILLGLLAFLFSIERRIKKLEKKQQE
jgi:protein-S-isoprenylcysteine O-methyltransferase Ste14